jgi:acyltransferase
MANKPTTPPREQWIDALKGWGMLLIVVGHVWSLSDVPVWYVWMFSFHVPLFFFAAGLTLKADSLPMSDFLRRRAQTLLVPYLIYALVGYVFYVLGYAAAEIAGKTVAQFSYGLWKPLAGVFYGSVGDGLLVNSPLWFLVALFLSQGAVKALNSDNRLSSAARYAILLLLFMVAAVVEEQVNPPFSLLPAMGAAIFIQFGLTFRRHDTIHLWSKLQTWIALLACLGVTLLSPFNGAVGLAGPTINHPALFLVFALAGIGFSVLMVRMLHARWQAGLAFVGRHSMGILVLHMLAIKGVKVVLSIATGVSLDTMEHSLPWGLLVLMVAALLMWPAIAIIERWLPWTLGMRR